MKPYSKYLTAGLYLAFAAACSEGDTRSSNPSLPAPEASSSAEGGGPPMSAGGASPEFPAAQGGEGGSERGGAPGGSPPVAEGSGGLGGEGGTPPGGGGGESVIDGDYTEVPGPEGNGNHTIGPSYPMDPDLTNRGNPKGRSFEFSLRLADSKILSEPVREEGKNREERKIFVYVPDQYEDGTEAPVLVIHDGPFQQELVSNALDNLTISPDPARRLPPFVVVGVENGGGERGLEYNTMSDRFARFINDEVLVAVASNPEIKTAYPGFAFTKNPWGRASMGCSSGGSAALSMAWFRPDLFRRVISWSGSFTHLASDTLYPLGAWEYHSGQKLIESTPKKPLRVFIHVDEKDLKEGPERDWVEANNKTADALKAAGYDYRYVYSLATGHCWKPVYDLAMADALVWTWRGYHAD
ncbi:MAG: hypothetical protein RJA70_115 [Pseudomonadota bacterium]|jgi:enterochelin esterase-like enzyme